MGVGSFADAALFRAPDEELLQGCLREAEEEEEAADEKGVVGREAEPREVLGPASLAALFTLR